MVVLVKLMGIVVVVFGVIFLLKPEAIRLHMDFWTKGKRIYPGAILSLLIGIIFLLAASQCRMTWVIALVGIWGIIKGVVLFVVGQEKLIAYIKWWKGRSVGLLRLLALLCLAIGSLIIYAA